MTTSRAILIAAAMLAVSVLVASRYETERGYRNQTLWVVDQWTGNVYHCYEGNEDGLCHPFTKDAQKGTTGSGGENGVATEGDWLDLDGE